MAIETLPGLLMTYEEYAALPDGLYQVIEGKVYMTPAPTPRHQVISGVIFKAISVFLDGHPFGKVFYSPIDVQLSPEAPLKLVQPDIIFISNERLSILTSKNIQGAPDLVVEILSPGTASLDVSDKKDLYERYGVQEYWIVWQDTPRVEVYHQSSFNQPTLLGRGDTLTTPLLPGFTLVVADLYADLP